MKKFALLIVLLSCIQYCLAETVVFGENSKFGLKDKQGNIITKAEYKKLVRLGETAWIMQDGTKFGVLSDDGKIIIKPKYNQAERVLGKFVKFRKGDKYGIFDEMGFEILPVEYSSIDLLYGGMFVTSKNYQYGITDLNGQIILDNIFDDIYMPDFNTLVIVYNNQVLEIKREGSNTVNVPFNIQSIHEDISTIKFSDITSSPLASTGYYSVTFTDYILKLLSSISPAYEQTIDELMFSQGADTVSVLVKCSWIPMFPFVYAKKYYKNVVAPFNGPLSKTKRSLRRKIKS